MDGSRASRVEEALLGPRSYGSHEVAALAGVPVYRARRFWRALGFGNVANDSLEFTLADVEALTTLLRLVEHGVVDEEQAVQLARSLGQALRRIADWQAQVLVEANPSRHPGGDQAMRDLESLLAYAYRRHLAAASNRLRPGDAESGSLTLAVGFADLVGYTTWSRQVEENELARMIERFESRSADILVAAGARVVKTLGDEVMFVADSPQTVAEAALRLVETQAREEALPPVRVGLALGPVAARMGDLFGCTVNLASRLTSTAPVDGILVDPQLAAALTEDREYQLRFVRQRALPGLAEVRPALLTRSATTDRTEVGIPMGRSPLGTPAR